jgi:hypothetical protein
MTHFFGHYGAQNASNFYLGKTLNNTKSMATAGTLKMVKILPWCLRYSSRARAHILRGQLWEFMISLKKLEGFNQLFL